MKIFLSSTFLDLKDTRQQISQWLTGVFGADLIVMETFGSDVAPPNVVSVRRVSECDIFVGVYAYRYGSIDAESGRSITELELDEAKHAHSTGTVTDILLYLVDEQFDWSRQYEETTQPAKVGLERLKQKAKQHTHTFFKNSDDLLFSVFRDIYRRISNRFQTTSRRLRVSSVPAAKPIMEPLGMDFLTSIYRNYLIGRERNIEQLLERINDAPIVLLLGDSGVGKTSVVHAGLIPRVASGGMRPIYTRPLGFPCADIVQKIQTTIFEGPPTYRGPIAPLLAEVTAALNGEKVLLVVDQFEDVLTAQSTNEVNRLISGLRTIHEAADPALRVLISYRADLEGRLGAYWQQISGSATGLPRQYLSGIEQEVAWHGIKKAAEDLSIALKLRDVEQERVSQDLLMSSRAAGFNGIYPPYIQMLIEHFWSSSSQGQKPYSIKNYQESGGMEGVIGGYLNRLIQYAQDREGHIRSVLISLVRSYGVKAQRTLSEVVSDTGLQASTCETALEKLIDLRLARHIDPYYEVSHDYIARKIIAELANSEERECKRFKELLASKAAAYQTTSSLLTHVELLMLYRYKERIIPNESEQRLLLASWVKGTGPALYWVLNAEKSKILDWLRTEESKEDLDEEEKISIILLRRQLGEQPLASKDYDAFRYYKLSAELSHLINENPLAISSELLMYGLRHRREEVRDACSRAIASQIKSGKWEWIRIIRKSDGAGCRNAYLNLVLNKDIPVPNQAETMGNPFVEFFLLKELVLNQGQERASEIFHLLKKRNPPGRILLFGRGLTYVRKGKLRELVRSAMRKSAQESEQLLAAISGHVSNGSFDALTSAYEQLNRDDFARYRSALLFPYKNSRIFRITNAIAEAIHRCVSARNLPRLRRCLRTISLTPSTRAIIHSLLKFGTISDLKLILHRLATANEHVDIWNHTELGRTILGRLEKAAEGVPRFLRDILDKKEFGEYIPANERAKHPKSELLALKSMENKGLYVRLAAYSAIGSATLTDEETLLNLTQHNFGLIARAAAVRLARLKGQDSLRELSAFVGNSTEEGAVESLAHALRSAEMQVFGLTS